MFVYDDVKKSGDNAIFRVEMLKMHFLEKFIQKFTILLRNDVIKLQDNLIISKSLFKSFWWTPLYMQKIIGLVLR